MEPVLSILREVRDPRAFNARHKLPAILFITIPLALILGIVTFLVIYLINRG